MRLIRLRPLLNWQSLTDDQKRGADFIASRPVSLLADRPGLGKTAQMVQAVDMLQPRRALVICPPILRDNIKREFERWSLWDEPVTVIRSGKDALPASGVVAISYQLATMRADALHDWGADFVACDEAHALKEPSAERTKKILTLKRRIVAKTRNMLWMTGTPAPNNLGELYTFARAAGVWSGNKRSFEEQFCVVVETQNGPKIVGNKNVALLKQMLAPVMLRRTAIAGLPPLRVASLPVPGDARALNAEMDEATRQAILDAERAGDWAFLSTPFIATIRRLAGIAKAPAVADLAINELGAGEPKVLIFAQHTAVIDAIRAALAERNIEAPVLDGRTPAGKRQSIIDAFERPNGPRVNIWQTQSASEGLTAVAGRRVLIAEPAWTPKDNTQMIARVWRKGQTREVVASLCTLAGSIDDTILRTLERKNRLLAEVL